MGVGLTRSTISPLLPSYFPIRGSSEQRPQGSERIGQHPWIRPTDQDGLLFKHQRRANSNMRHVTPRHDMDEIAKRC